MGLRSFTIREILEMDLTSPEHVEEAKLYRLFQDEMKESHDPMTFTKWLDEMRKNGMLNDNRQ